MAWQWLLSRHFHATAEIRFGLKSSGVELRFEPVEFKLGKHKLGLGLKGYVDMGMVAQRAEDLPLHLHVSGGPGLLIVWDRFAVIRLDGGFSRETRGFYLMTEHAF